MSFLSLILYFSVLTQLHTCVITLFLSHLHPVSPFCLSPPPPPPSLSLPPSLMHTVGHTSPLSGEKAGNGLNLFVTPDTSKCCEGVEVCRHHSSHHHTTCTLTPPPLWLNVHVHVQCTWHLKCVFFVSVLVLFNHKPHSPL